MGIYHCISKKEEEKYMFHILCFSKNSDLVDPIVYAIDWECWFLTQRSQQSIANRYSKFLFIKKLNSYSIINRLFSFCKQHLKQNFINKNNQFRIDSRLLCVENLNF